MKTKKILSTIIIIAVLFIQTISVYADIIGEGYDVVTGKWENGVEVFYPTGDRQYKPVYLNYGDIVKFNLAAEDTSVAKVIWSVGDKNIVEITETSYVPNVNIKAVSVGHTTLYAYKMSYAVATGEYSLIGICSIPIDVIDSGTWEITVQPTKTETGIAVKTLDSGRQILEEIPPLLNASVWFPKQTVNATCTESGYVIYFSKYGEVKDIIPAANHQWVKMSETDLGNGESCISYKCSMCETTKIEKKYTFLYYKLSNSTIGIYGFESGTNLSGEIRFPSEIDGYKVKEICLDSWESEYNLSNVTGIVFESGIEKINTSFADLENLEYVLLPDTLENICSSTFKNCVKLKQLEIPGSVKSIGEEAFSGCTLLDTVIICEGVEQIDGYAFWKCPIESLSLPSTIKILKNGCFEGSKITKLSMPKGVNTFSLGAFSNVEYYYLPSSVMVINDLYALNSSCKGIYVSNNNPNYSSDEYGVLYNKEKSQLLVYPAELNKTYYNIPDGVETIGSVAFGNHEQKYLEIIYFPETLTQISNSAFFNCQNLCRVIYNGTDKNYSEINIELGNDILGNAELIFTKTEETADESLPNLNVEFAKTSSRWYFDVSNETYSEGAIIYIGIYDENGKLLTVKLADMISDDVTSISINQVENYSYAKIFEWVNMKPITKVKTVPLM